MRCCTRVAQFHDEVGRIITLVGSDGDGLATGPQAHRGGLRLGRDHRGPRQDQASRDRPREIDLRLGRCRIQPDPFAQAPRRIDKHPRSLSDDPGKPVDKPENKTKPPAWPYPSCARHQKSCPEIEFFRSLLKMADKIVFYICVTELPGGGATFPVGHDIHNAASRV